MSTPSNICVLVLGFCLRHTRLLCLFRRLSVAHLLQIPIQFILEIGATVLELVVKIQRGLGIVGFPTGLVRALSQNYLLYLVMAFSGLASVVIDVIGPELKPADAIIKALYFQ